MKKKSLVERSCPVLDTSSQVSFFLGNSVVFIPGKRPTNIIPKLVVLYTSLYICKPIFGQFFNNNYQITCSESECNC